MLILNAIATSYLVWRIFAFRFGFIKDLSTTKKNGWCKRRKSRWKKGAASPYQVHAVALNIDDRVSNTSSVRFDADSLTVICDNSANVHICNNKGSFVGDIEMDKSLQVATIGGKQNASAGSGTVRWKWKDDDGVFHTFEI